MRVPPTVVTKRGNAEECWLRRQCETSIGCDANAKQALVATKGGLSPPRSVLKHQGLSPPRSVLKHQDLSPQRSPEGPRKTEGRNTTNKIQKYLFIPLALRALPLESGRAVINSSTRRRGEVAVYRRRGAVNSTATMLIILDRRTKEHKTFLLLRMFVANETWRQFTQ